MGTEPMKVLVVDDSATIRVLASKLLREWGFEPVCARDAFEVLSMLEKAEIPRLILADWVMPGMEGPELIRKLRDHDPDRSRYIIMLTSKTGRDVLETSFACGADDYLAKPSIEKDLRSRVMEGKNILDRHDAVMSS